jgi:hypothetical protein
VWTTWWEAAHGWQPWFLVNNAVKVQPGATVTALEEYLHAAGIAGDSEGPLFRAWRNGQLHRKPLNQSNVHKMIRRRASRHQNKDRLSQLSCHRHHELPEERRPARDRATDGGARKLADDGPVRQAGR